MSWINNALKGAELARPKDATPANAQVPPSADWPAPRRASNLALTLLILAVMSLSGFMTWEWFRASSAEMKVRARSNASGVNPVAEPPALRPSTVTSASMETKPAPNTEAVVEKKPITEAAPEAPKPAPVIYKLQGVVYAPGHSSAVINGKTVVAGERVGDARVVSIDKDTALIVTASGQTNVLDLE